MNSPQPAIQKALENVCSKFPETIRGECKVFVDAYTPAIVNLLVQEIDPKKVCTLLGLCQKTQEGIFL
jgi:saposin